MFARSAAHSASSEISPWVWSASAWCRASVTHAGWEVTAAASVVGVYHALDDQRARPGLAHGFEYLPGLFGGGCLAAVEVGHGAGIGIRAGIGPPVLHHRDTAALQVAHRPGRAAEALQDHARGHLHRAGEAVTEVAFPLGHLRSEEGRVRMRGLGFALSGVFPFFEFRSPSLTMMVTV